MTCSAFGTSFHDNGMTHLQVPVHNVMLVNVAHALQDLINAVTERETQKREGENESGAKENQSFNTRKLRKQIKKGKKKKKKKLTLQPPAGTRTSE